MCKLMNNKGAKGGGGRGMGRGEKEKEALIPLL